MQVDEPSNSSTDRCTLKRNLGKSYTLLIPTSKKASERIESNPVIVELAQQFDNVYATPIEHCSAAGESSCKSGIRVEALRRIHKEGSQQDYSDMTFLLRLANDDLPKTNRVRLVGINENVTIYSMKCESNRNSGESK